MLTKAKTIIILLAIIPLLTLGENKVKVGDFLKTVLLTGSLKARKSERFVVPRSNTWQIQLKWMVKEGENINPGDLVVRFDTSTLVTDIENTEMSLQDRLEQKTQKLAEYDHEKLELELKLKQAEVENQKKTLDAAIPKGITSNHEYDKRQLDKNKTQEALNKAKLEKQVKLATMKSEIKQLDIEIEEERAKLTKNHNILKDLTLYAKTKGTIVYAEHPWQEGRKIQVGDNVYATMTVAKIPDNSSLLVEAWANETDINGLKPGQKAEIYLDAYQDKRLTGTVKDILNNAEKRRHWGRAHYFMVLIELDSLDHSIMKPGMSIRCLIRTEEHPQVQLIPIEMVLYENNTFWIKPKGKTPYQVKPLGFNEFFVAVKGDPKLKEGTSLQPVSSSDIKEARD